MKNKHYIIALLAVLLAGCQKDNIWENHENPRVYIPKNGFSINKAWLLDEETEYSIVLSVYCSGLRPNKQKDEISVTYALAPELIPAYNSDVTQEYAGMITELPAECYKFTDTEIIIPKGKSHGEIPIKIDLEKMKTLDLGLNEVKYAIPLKLQSTSLYNLHENPAMLDAIFCITIDQPNFYFWNNRDEQKEVGKKVIYDNEIETDEYLIKSYGVPLGKEYTLNIEIDPSALNPGELLLPENAYELPKTSLTIPANSSEINLPVKIINNEVEFRKSFYLPIRIVSTSKYIPHPDKSLLKIKVTIKNDYEWSYSSKMSVECEKSQRSGGYAVTKAPTSYERDIIRIQMLTNNTVAGATGTSTSSNKFNDKYYLLKIIPTDNKNRWNVEIIKESGTPDTLELDPDKESYYDWDYETFHMNYRFKDQDNGWVYVSEILEAQ